MTATRDNALLESMERRPASDVRTKGWPDIVASVQRQGRMLVTNHNRVEVVLLSLDEYSNLVGQAEAGQARKTMALDALREQFDQQLASLQADDAGARLEKAFEAPVKLKRKAKAGDF